MGGAIYGEHFFSYLKLPDLDTWIGLQSLLCVVPHLSKYGTDQIQISKFCYQKKNIFKVEICPLLKVHNPLITPSFRRKLPTKPGSWDILIVGCWMGGAIYG